MLLRHKSKDTVEANIFFINLSSAAALENFGKVDSDAKYHGNII